MAVIKTLHLMYATSHGSSTIGAPFRDDFSQKRLLAFRLLLIGGVIDAIKNRRVLIIAHIHAVKTPHIKAIFRGITAPPVIDISAANLAEIMFSRMGIELIKRERVLPFFHPQLITRHRCGWRRARIFGPAER